MKTPASSFGNRGCHTLSHLAGTYEYALRYNEVVDGGEGGGPVAVPTGAATATSRCSGTAAVPAARTGARARSSVPAGRK